MDKEALLQAYIEIETKTFIKADKKAKLDQLFASFQKDNPLFELTDVLDIVNNLTKRAITIRQPLFVHVIYPVLAKETGQDSVEAIKALLELDRQLISYQAYSKDHAFSSWSLLERGLVLAPDDVELLTLFEQRQRGYFEYTLHELPTGVLYGNDGASIEECEDLLKQATHYEEVCSKLLLDRQDLINKCRYYYTTYAQYLSDYKPYDGFGDFLEKHPQGE